MMRVERNLFIAFWSVLILTCVSCSGRHQEYIGYFFDSEGQKVEKNTETQSEYSIDSTALEMPRLMSELPHQLLKRVGYTTSYNQKTLNPNWVAWHLTAEHTEGSCSRKGIYYAEDHEACGVRQKLEDWKGRTEGLDHGHMCPAADNKWSEEAMKQTFLLTNMCPQNHDLNGGDWEYLESRCRGWARHYGDVYIVAGPIFYNSSYQTMGANKVGIPDAFFKVILCMKGKSPKALGFIYPNEGTHHPLDYYLLTVDEVEQQTGIDFFFNLPDDIEERVESQSDLSKW